jgi:hypothetical protein
MPTDDDVRDPSGVQQRHLGVGVPTEEGLRGYERDGLRHPRQFADDVGDEESLVCAYPPRSANLLAIVAHCQAGVHSLWAASCSRRSRHSFL